MQTAMVPDAHHLLSTALPLGPPADHAKTLEAVWRPGPAAFYEPARQPWDAPVGQTSLCGATLLDTSTCAAATRLEQPAWSQHRAEPCAVPGQTSLYPARSEPCAAGLVARTAASSRPAAQQTVLYPPAAADRSSCGVLARAETARSSHAGPYPGRAVPVPTPVPAPLRSSRVSSSSDARVTKDFSQPLFVDTTVEYDLPKAAYPPENSEPLLIVHPQYYEHLRHRRTLGAGCACQLCNFYGRRLPVPASAAASVPSVSAGPAGSAAASAAGTQTFQRPGVPRDWPAFQLPQQQQQQLPQQQQQQKQSQHLLQPQQQQHRHLQQHQQQQRQQQLLNQPLRQPQQTQHVQQPQQLLQPQQQQQRYTCMFGGVGERRLSLAPPSGSCDSDSGYSSVELETAEWCRRPADQARDVLVKRKRRLEPTPAPLPATKRPRPAFWQSEF